jgi:lipopolysaccharide/colanic/teichoic acid biosynthesis glycosyltransferase
MSVVQSLRYYRSRNFVTSFIASRDAISLLLPPSFSVAGDRRLSSAPVGVATKIEEHPADRPRTSRGERHVPRWWFAAKRATDIVFAVTALVVSAPIVTIAIVAIMINSPGWPIFAQQRVGLYGRRFTIYKLRTMRPNAHAYQASLRAVSDVTGPVFKMKNDPRVFPVGRIVRKLSIDEIPNLVNVLLGQMSIVGPRPPLPSEVEGYSDFALRRLRAKPGITCLWQCSGRSSVDFDRWMELDNQYIDNWSPTYDLTIILNTIPAVLLGKGAY